MGANLGTATLKLDLNDDGYFVGLRKAEGRADQLDQKFGKLSSGLTAVGGAITGIGVGIGLAVNEAINAASDLGESANAVNVIFGEGAEKIHAFGETSATSVLLARSEFNQLAATTGALFTNFGDDTDTAAEKTINVTQRAADLASVFNTDVTQALEAMGAGIRGETEPMRRFAVDLTDASLQAFLVSKGLQGNVRDLSQAEKAQLRYTVMMEQSNKVQGDVANTLEGWANQKRLLRAQLVDFASVIGEYLIPQFEGAVKWVTDMVRGVRDWVQENPELTGTIVKVTAAVGGVSLVLGPMLLALGGIAAIAPSIVVGLGAVVGILMGPVGIAVAVGAAVTALGVYVETSEDADETLRDIWNGIKAVWEGLVWYFTEVWWPAIKTVFDGFVWVIKEVVWPIVSNVVGAIIDTFKGLWEAGKGFLQLLGFEFEDVTDKMEQTEPALEGVADKMEKRATPAAKELDTTLDKAATTTKKAEKQLNLFGREVVTVNDLLREMRRDRLLIDFNAEMDTMARVTLPDVEAALADVSSQASATELPIADLSDVMGDLGFDAEIAGDQSEQAFKDMAAVIKTETDAAKTETDKLSRGVETMKIRILDDLEELISGEKSFKQFAQDVGKTLLQYFISGEDSVLGKVLNDILGPLKQAFTDFFSSVLGGVGKFVGDFLGKLLGLKGAGSTVTSALTGGAAAAGGGAAAAGGGIAAGAGGVAAGGGAITAGFGGTLGAGGTLTTAGATTTTTVAGPAAGLTWLQKMGVGITSKITGALPAIFGGGPVTMAIFLGALGLMALAGKLPKGNAPSYNLNDLIRLAMFERDGKPLTARMTELKRALAQGTSGIHPIDLREYYEGRILEGTDDSDFPWSHKGSLVRQSGLVNTEAGEVIFPKDAEVFESLKGILEQTTRTVELGRDLLELTEEIEKITQRQAEYQFESLGSEALGGIYEEVKGLRREAIPLLRSMSQDQRMNQSDSVPSSPDTGFTDAERRARNRTTGDVFTEANRRIFDPNTSAQEREMLIQMIRTNYRGFRRELSRVRPRSF